MAIRRNRYNLSHYWTTSFPMGYIVPFLCQEVVPGDTWNVRSPVFIRTAPLARPTFSVWTLHLHAFFVPHRIVWDEWEDFITDSESTATPPTITASRPTEAGPRNQYLPSYFGVGNAPSVLALPFRAYNLVYNEFFRDQDLRPERSMDNVTAAIANYQHDYFSNLRNEIQQGAEATAPVVNSAVAMTAIRDAMHLQKVKERRSQFGSRYHDYLAAMGVSARDARLDRPEHVGSHRQVIGISEVLSTADTTGADVGDYKGHGVAGAHFRIRRRFFAEHGTLLGLAYVRPRNTLRRRVDRMFLSSEWDDWFQQELATDTQVGVVAREVSDLASSTDIYGYTARDEWLRTGRDTVAGAFDIDSTENQEWVSSRSLQNPPPAITSAAWNWAQPSSYVGLFQETGIASFRRQFRMFTHNRCSVKRMVRRRPK